MRTCVCERVGEEEGGGRAKSVPCLGVFFLTQMVPVTDSTLETIPEYQTPSLPVVGWFWAYL